METAPLNPDLAFSDLEAEMEDEYDEEVLEETDDELEEETHEIVVSLDNLEEASKKLQSLALENISSVRIECREIVDMELLPSILETKAPIQITPTAPEARQDSGISKKLSGPAICHICRVKCRPALQFTCKCEKIFCHLHRYHDQHHCPIDIASIDRAGLSKANPRIVKDRL
jgi:hypothetical protein